MKPLFLALKANLNNYENIQSDFANLLEGRWVPDENLHLTINYFGNKYSVEEILEKLPKLITPIPTQTLSGLDYFKTNKILYAKSTSMGIARLSDSISKKFSLKQTKEFVPHVTLMRIKNITDIDSFKEVLESYKNEDLGSVETTLHLMESEIRHPGGAVYTSIKSF
ncbi:RNA 2',3'-cyclic phosphodiesterase [Sulfurimonas sp. C5]|uniref:RNA 2',3'-cyclic phosphodiesterase n=1 Tax=Sulfurimonas sp. C5 TaxID=3036947 RepID=UPI00245430B7|nr:RNA 2',3'-cyclic phosphodiesterase [Sulfurimonas sp. C5]MDH4944424.1 RNA 2',3'-cyclic phosphodiesterase [Sulfurimonas sp. C5]